MDGEKTKMAATPNATPAVTGVNNLAMGPILSQKRNRGGDQTVEAALPLAPYIGRYKRSIYSSPRIGHIL
jgi:hypothetical protein